MTQEEFFNRYKYDRTKDRIGGGGFGNVYKVFDTIENETVALKIAEVRQGEENLSLKKEVELASTMERHVNIARYTACHRFDLPNGHFDFGLLQYYPLGNLSQLVKSKKLNEADKVGIAQGIISGIHHLHSHNVVHRDLKSANILIAEGYHSEYVPKIADFGLSKQFAQNENSYFSNSFAGGSLLYVAPEQLEGKELRKNVDLWSLGVVLYELFVGETPFKASVDDGSETARAEIIQKIRSASIPSSISNIPHPWQEVIKVCLVTNPAQRIKSIEDVKGIMKDSNNKISHEATQPEFDKSPRQGSDLENGKTTLEKVKDLEESKNESPAWLWILSIIIFLSVIVWLWAENLFENENSKENTEIIEKIPASEEDVWQNALSNKTESAYARYLFLYPDGKYAMEAKKRAKGVFEKPNRVETVQKKVDDKSENNSSNSNFKSDYNETVKPIESNHSSIQILNSPSLIEKTQNEKDMAEWNFAKTINTIKSYNEYIESNKSGTYVKEATEAIDKLNKPIKPIVKYENISEFADGMAKVKYKGKYGYIDKSEQIVIPCIYTDAYRFSEGFAVVKLTDKFGYIDKNGKQVIPFDYDYASSFSGGLARVQSKGNWFSINKSGKCTKDCKFK